MSTWDKPAEIAELQLGYHRQGSHRQGSHLETCRKNHTSVSTIPVNDFFNPIPPPSLKHLSKGLSIKMICLPINLFFLITFKLIFFCRYLCLRYIEALNNIPECLGIYIIYFFLCRIKTKELFFTVVAFVNTSVANILNH